MQQRLPEPVVRAALASDEEARDLRRMRRAAVVLGVCGASLLALAVTVAALALADGVSASGLVPMVLGPALKGILASGAAAVLGTAAARLGRVRAGELRRSR